MRIAIANKIENLGHTEERKTCRITNRWPWVDKMQALEKDPVLNRKVCSTDPC